MVRKLFDVSKKWTNGVKKLRGTFCDTFLQVISCKRFSHLLQLIEPGSPCENRCNQFRPHSSLNYRPPAPETIKQKVEILT